MRKGKIAINIRGLEFLQAKPGEDPRSAYNRMKAKIPSGKHLEETWILLPDAVPAAGGYKPPAPRRQGARHPVEPPATGSLFPTTPFSDPPTGAPAERRSNTRSRFHFRRTRARAACHTVTPQQRRH